MTTYAIGQSELLALSILVLFVGMALNRKVDFLARNFIPPAVTGGLLFALVAWVLHDGLNTALEFNMSLRDYLLLMFFSTVGLSVRMESLKQGGRSLPLLVVAAGVFLVLQNTVGVAIALGLDADPVYGLMAGSVSFAGGHGTAIAWGSEFESAGFAGASVAGLTFATFGLVAGGMIGGPIARQLMKRTVAPTAPDPHDDLGAEPPVAKAATGEEGDWLITVLGTLMLIALCVSLGGLVNAYISEQGLMLPGFLTAMFVGILINNFTPAVDRTMASVTIERFGTVSLHIFLAMSMMTVELWTLVGAVQTIVLVLLLQVLLMTVFAMFVVFYIAGRDYDAVVIAAGFSGLGLGATPVAIANMNAVTSIYGPSAKAMILIPLIGAFFIDLLNAGVIQFFLSRIG